MKKLLFLLMVSLVLNRVQAEPFKALIDLSRLQTEIFKSPIKVSFLQAERFKSPLSPETLCTLVSKGVLLTDMIDITQPPPETGIPSADPSGKRDSYESLQAAAARI